MTFEHAKAFEPLAADLKLRTIHRLELRVTRVGVADEAAPYCKILRSSPDVAQLAITLIGSAASEVLLVFHLSARNQVTGYSEVARGGINACSLDARDVFRAAILDGANGIILAHNHPSGDTTPSDADRSLTRTMAAAGKLLGISLLDHVIVASDGPSYSFLDHSEL
jgi:DNA repair protein RadC